MFLVPWKDNSLISSNPQLVCGLTGQETMDWICCCHQKPYDDNLRYTKCIEMPARRMSWTTANHHVFKTWLPFTCISLYPSLPPVSRIRFPPLTPNLCFLARCSSSSSNKLMICFIEGPFLDSTAIRKLVRVDAFTLSRWSAAAKLCSALELFLSYPAPEKSQTIQWPVFSFYSRYNFWSALFMLAVSLTIFCNKDELLVARLYQFFSASAYPCTWVFVLCSRCCKKLSCSKWHFNLFE